MPQKTREGMKMNKNKTITNNWDKISEEQGTKEVSEKFLHSLLKVPNKKLKEVLHELRMRISS